MEAWTYQPAPDLARPLASARRLLTHTRTPDWGPLRRPLRTAGACVIRMALATYFRFRVVGRDNLPASGSFVMIANHASHLDGLCMVAALPLPRIHQAFPAAAADYFFKSAPLGFLTNLFMNALPFSRKGNVRQTLEACRNVLAGDSNALILFPEGTRTTTGQISPFKNGVAQLVAGTNTPVVPCHLDGAFAAWPKGRLFPSPRKLTLTIGQPLTFAHLKKNRPNCDQITKTLEDAVRALKEGGTADVARAARP